MLTLNCAVFMEQVRHTRCEIFYLNSSVSDQTCENLRRLTDAVSDCVLAAFARFYKENLKDEGRLAKLLLLLSPVKSIQPDQLEELFFPGLVGSVKIDNVIPYIVTMGGGMEEKQVEDNEMMILEDNTCELE